MAVNIGPKIGIDGEKEYRKSINDLITQQKTFSSEMKNLESTFTKETTAMEKNRKKAELLTRQVKNQEEQVDKLEYGLKKAKEKFGENAAETQKWQQAVNNAKSELNRLRTELDNIPGKLGSMGQSLVESGNKMQETGRKLTDSITTPLMNIGKNSLDAFNEVREGMNAIITKTGITGDSLDSLEQSMRNIATSIPTDFATAGQAIGEVNTRFGLTGEALEKLSTQFIKFAKLNKTDVSSSVDATDKILKAFGEDADEAGTLLDAMNQVGQDTGISMNTLQSSLVTNAAALHSMGMDSKDAAFFLGQVETSGANVNDVMAGLKKATANASKQGKTLNDVLREFDDTMRSSKSDQEKLTAAINIFGAKAGPTIYNAYKTGSLSFQNLASDASRYMGSVQDTFEATQTPLDKMTVILNKVKDSGSRLGASVLRVLSPAIDGLANVAEDVCDAFDSMPESAQNVLVVGGLVAAGIGPAITLVGKLKSGIGAAMLAIDGLKIGSGTLSALAGPIGIAIAGVGALAAILISTSDQFAQADEKVQKIVDGLAESDEKLVEATGKLKTTMSDLQKNIDDVSNKDIAAQPMIDELYKLEAQTHKTADEQMRMETLVDELNEMFPGLALSIDKSTYSLSKGKGEVQAYVEQAKHLAMADAYIQGAQEAAKAIAEARVKAAEAYKEWQDSLKEYEAYEGVDGVINVDDAVKWEEQLASLEQHYYDCNDAIKEAEETRSLWLQGAEEEQKAAEKSAEALEKSTKSTDKNTKAKKSNTKAEDDNIKKFAKIISGTSDAADETEEYTEEVEENTAAVKKQGSATLEAVKKIVEANQNEAKAWGDSYKAAKDSITSKTGLFKEWKVEITKTAGDILANLKQQNADLKAYTENLALIEKAALDSGNVNASAFVEYIRQAGIDGAAEVAAIAEDLRNGGDTMYAIMDEWGNNYTALSDNIATTAANAQVVIERDMFGLVKIGNDKLKELGGAAVADVVTKGLTGLAGKITTAYTDAQNAALKSTDTWVGRIQETINQKKITANLHALNVKTASQEAVPRIEKYASGAIATVGSVAVKAAATAAKNSIGNYLYGLGGVVTSIGWSGAASAAWNSIYNYFANNPVKIAAKLNAGGALGAALAGYARGGIITRQQVAVVGEGNKPEAIIPLAPESRSRAITLYQEVGAILGADSVGRQSASVPLPTSNGLDLDALYSAVAAGAAEGLENANVRIYWDSREAGRIMRNMGVQFA